MEQEQEDEEDFEVEVPRDKVSQVNVLWDFYANGNDDDEEDSIEEIHTNEIHT